MSICLVQMLELIQGCPGLNLNLRVILISKKKLNAHQNIIIYGRILQPQTLHLDQFPPTHG